MALLNRLLTSKAIYREKLLFFHLQHPMQYKLKIPPSILFSASGPV